ncbi:hypothetical protein [Ruania zhangjianzhongii]|uniref:hypothetical protein n=1 Tax=Ruania zhangjianzhongii TaxID=2603206 RepID=UPI00143CCE09|nr:hypothetical protein [Ruania zhangjianzhongii]
MGDGPAHTAAVPGVLCHGWCELIDDLTLDQLVADRERSEAVCATSIDAENSVDQQ